MNNAMKEYREKIGLKQSKMAEQLGIAVSTYNMIENGKRGVSVIVAKRISLVLDTSIDNLFFKDYVHIT